MKLFKCLQYTGKILHCGPLPEERYWDLVTSQLKQGLFGFEFLLFFMKFAMESKLFF